MTSKIDQIEVEAAAADLGRVLCRESLEKKFAVLKGDQEVDARLAALKAKMGKATPA